MKAILIALLALAPLTASAASMSRDYRQWGEGPEQWIMTRDEQRAWKAVDTDEEAIAFIDLFWARRDPTPGTPANEFRNEFAGRVAYADRNFSERGRRGALSDRGRVYVTLGPARRMQAQMKASSDQAVSVGAAEQTGGGGDATGGRELGARDVWEWEHLEAQKFGLPAVTVVFVADPITRRVIRDTQRGDFLAAEPAAIALNVKNPELTSLPDWAARGGLHPMHLEKKLTVGAVPSASAPSAMLPKGEAGASRLTLVRDVFALDSQKKGDLFEGLTPLSTFTKQDELGWAARYCSDSEVSRLNVGLKISGEINGETHNITADPDDVTPDRLKAMSNCYLVRGAIPLSEMDAGTYELEITIADPATNQSYNLKSQFKVE
ncbi:MAG TPA: GWxTD domain-containing protein [Thermoanaerobaculia bacterium]|jgi:GWxTD domain-containing protein